MQSLAGCQPRRFRRGSGTGQGLVAKLFQFLLQAFSQVFRAPEQPFAGPGLQEQCVPVAGETHLAAVLVAPRGQKFQCALFRSPVMSGFPWFNDLLFNDLLFSQATGVEIQGQLREADCQPALHGIQFDSVVSHKLRKVVEPGRDQTAGFRGT